MQAGTGREHPARKDALHFATQRDFIDLHERIGVGRLGGRPRVADPRRDLKRPELDGFANRGVERNRTARDLVQACKHRAGVFDLLRRHLGDNGIVGLRRCVGRLLRRGVRGRRKRSALGRQRLRRQRCSRRRWQRLRLNAGSWRTGRRSRRRHRIVRGRRRLEARWRGCVYGRRRGCLPWKLHRGRLGRNAAIRHASGRPRRRIATSEERIELRLGRTRSERPAKGGQ